MTFVPTSTAGSTPAGKLYIELDGTTLHTYHLPPQETNDSQLSRTGTVNMKMINRGRMLENDPVNSMTHFEGVTYLLRSDVIQAWDLEQGTFLTEIPLPEVQDPWVGFAFERPSTGDDSLVLHMLLDAFPPQIWTFHLLQDDTSNSYSFPECVGVEDAESN